MAAWPGCGSVRGRDVITSIAPAGLPMRVDAHLHLWDLARRPQPWTDALPPLQRSFAFPDLQPSLIANEVRATVVVHTVASFEETLELLALADQYDEIAGVVGWFDLSSPELGTLLTLARSAPGGRFLVGARHQLQEEPDPLWLVRPKVREGLAQLAAAGLAYDVVVSAHQLPTVIAAVQTMPELRFVLDHAGKPPISCADISAWAADLTTLAAFPNVAVKLSGLVTEADWNSWTVDQLRPVVEHVLAQFGPQRTMFGSDWPVCLLAADYETVVASTRELVESLSTDDKAAIWGVTASTWYRLDGR